MTENKTIWYDTNNTPPEGTPLCCRVAEWHRDHWEYLTKAMIFWLDYEMCDCSTRNIFVEMGQDDENPDNWYFEARKENDDSCRNQVILWTYMPECPDDTVKSLKVFKNVRRGGHCGGMILVAAHSAKEAHEVFHADERYNYMWYKFEDGSFDDFEYCEKDWQEMTTLLTNVDKPQVLAEEGYTE